jgi:hypothetical protein
MVSCALVAVARFSLLSMVRIRAFENFLRNNKGSSSDDNMSYAEKMKLLKPDTFVNKQPRPEEMATAVNPFPAGPESKQVLKPILEVIDYIYIKSRTSNYLYIHLSCLPLLMYYNNSIGLSIYLAFSYSNTHMSLHKIIKGGGEIRCVSSG